MNISIILVVSVGCNMKNNLLLKLEMLQFSINAAKPGAVEGVLLPATKWPTSLNSTPLMINAGAPIR